MTMTLETVAQTLRARDLFAEAEMLETLIPKADAEMAVALAYQRAAELIPPSNLRQEVLALAPAEPLAEVARLSAKLELVQRALEKTDEGLEYMGLYAPALTTFNQKTKG